MKKIIAALIMLLLPAAVYAAPSLGSAPFVPENAYVNTDFLKKNAARIKTSRIYIDVLFIMCEFQPDTATETTGTGVSGTAIPRIRRLFTGPWPTA